jgi:hypothetical protein
MVESGDNQVRVGVSMTMVDQRRSQAEYRLRFRRQSNRGHPKDHHSPSSTGLKRQPLFECVGRDPATGQLMRVLFHRGLRT